MLQCIVQQLTGVSNLYTYPTILVLKTVDTALSNLGWPIMSV